MLKDIWSLPRQSSNRNPGVSAAREALWILGKLLYHLVFPYLCVELSLSEQVEHLSVSAHLALALYTLAGKDFIPTDLYIDMMIMIKNVIFSIAKAMVDNPDGEFWIILLGTDRLEELFGILRTMVGTDSNSDIVSRLSGTTEVSNILAKYPKWDDSPRRLKLPAMSRESNEPIPDSVDHIKPGSWRGNVYVKDVSLQISWNRGCYQVEQACEFIKPVLVKLDQNKAIDILSPSGTMLFNLPLADDDIDESLECPSLPIISDRSADPNVAETRIIVEDALAKLKLSTPRLLHKNKRLRLIFLLTGSSSQKHGCWQSLASTENGRGLQIACAVCKTLNNMFKTKILLLTHLQNHSHPRAMILRSSSYPTVLRAFYLATRKFGSVLGKLTD